MLSKILTYAPGVGLVGFAVYQAINLHDVAAAGQSLTQAAAVFGVGSSILSLVTKVEQALGKV